LDLSLGVFPFQRGQIDHADRQFNPFELGAFFDRALAQPCGSLFDSNLTHCYYLYFSPLLTLNNDSHSILKIF